MPRNVTLQFGIVTSSAPTSALTEDVNISTVSGDAVIGNPYGDLELEAVRGEKARCTQADAWLRTHPGARDPVQRHLGSEPVNLGADAASTPRGQLAQVRQTLPGRSAAPPRLPAPPPRSASPRHPPPVIATTSLSTHRDARKNGRWCGKHTRGAGLPEVSPVAATDFYEPSVQV